MKKKLIIILSCIVLLGTITVISYSKAAIFNLTDFRVKYLDISSSELPASFNKASVKFFSDLEYGTYFREKRLDKFIREVENLNADVVIFGGDLFDKVFSPYNEDVEKLTESLSKIKAPFGKFAILGDFDQVTDQRKALATKILNDAGFELLDNNPIALHHDTNEFINLIGINYFEGDIDMSEHFLSAQPTQYNLTVIHGAAVFDILPIGMSDYTLSGHSHHMQVNLPLMVNREDYQQTAKYTTGKVTQSNATMYITKGVGTTDKDYRFFSDPEIVFLRFKATR